MVFPTKQIQKLGHACRFAILKQIVLLLHQILPILYTFNLHLAQLDLREFVLLTLALLNDKLQILLANLAISVLFIDSVLVLDLTNLTVQVIYHALLVILQLQEVLIDDIHCVWSHLLLLLFIGFGKLFNDLFISIFEFARVFNFSIKI